MRGAFLHFGFSLQVAVLSAAVEWAEGLDFRPFVEIYISEIQRHGRRGMQRVVPKLSCERYAPPS